MTYEELTKSQMTIQDYIEYHKSSYKQWMDNLTKGEDERRCSSMAKEHLKMFTWLSEAKKSFDGTKPDTDDIDLNKLTALIERLEKANEDYRNILKGM